MLLLRAFLLAFSANMTAGYVQNKIDLSTKEQSAALEKQERRAPTTRKPRTT